MASAFLAAVSLLAREAGAAGYGGHRLSSTTSALATGWIPSLALVTAWETSQRQASVAVKHASITTDQLDKVATAVLHCNLHRKLCMPGTLPLLSHMCDAALNRDGSGMDRVHQMRAACKLARIWQHHCLPIPGSGILRLLHAAMDESTLRGAGLDDLGWLSHTLMMGKCPHADCWRMLLREARVRVLRLPAPAPLSASAGQSAAELEMALMVVTNAGRSACNGAGARGAADDATALYLACFPHSATSANLRSRAALARHACASGGLELPGDFNDPCRNADMSPKNSNLSKASSTQATLFAAAVRVCEQHGAPRPALEYPTHFGAKIDIAWPVQCLALEYDGPDHFAIDAQPGDVAAVVAACYDESSTRTNAQDLLDMLDNSGVDPGARTRRIRPPTNPTAFRDALSSEWAALARNMSTSVVPIMGMEAYHRGICSGRWRLVPTQHTQSRDFMLATAGWRVAHVSFREYDRAVASSPGNSVMNGALRLVDAKLRRAGLIPSAG